MSQLTYVAYVAAGLRFLYAGHRLTLVLLSLILLVWFIVLAAIRDQVVTDEPGRVIDGWTGSLSSRSAETLTAMRGVSASSSMMLIGLSMFAPLLAVWAFLP